MAPLSCRAAGKEKLLNTFPSKASALFLHHLLTPPPSRGAQWQSTARSGQPEPCWPGPSPESIFRHLVERAQEALKASYLNSGFEEELEDVVRVVVEVRGQGGASHVLAVQNGLGQRYGGLGKVVNAVTQEPSPARKMNSAAEEEEFHTDPVQPRLDPRGLCD